MKIGAQIYSMRSIINNASELEKAFEFLHSCGAQAVEMVDFPFANAAKVAELSSRYGLEIGSTHSNYNRLIGDTERLICEHLEYGSKIAGVGGMPLSRYNIKSRDSMLKFCEDMSRAADIACKYGVTIDYHNHAFEFKRIAGERIIDIIISNTSDNVKLCFDIYWAKVGGSSAEEYLTKHIGKINVLHFKDYVKKFIGSRYATVGEGILDIEGIYRLAVTQGVQFGYIEHDKPHDPKQVLSQGIKALLSY